ncbi:MAG: DUF4302 domain-containing protein [Prevotellaceae bacterium]|jgi:hypothetical protein|nr:DUF4302 domain-containing protein [Prevotellaceae bacterium]
MKRTVIILLSITSVVLSSCKFEEPDLFDDSAANRLLKAQAEYTKILCSAPNGWVMDYFPNVDSEYASTYPNVDMSGRTLLVKFQDGAATLASKHNLTGNRFMRDTCAFAVITDNGPVLSFNTYGENGLLHFFADPGPYPTSDELGVGYYGDYEFMVLNATAEVVKLKGKKHGTYIDLRRLPDSQDWESYFQMLADKENNLLDTRVTLVLRRDDEVIYTLSEGYSHTFNALPPGGDPISQTTRTPFMITDYGLLLAKNFETDSLKTNVRTFRLNAEGTKLIADENSEYSITPPSLDMFLQQSTSVFLATKENITGMDALFDQISAEFVSAFNSTRALNSIGFGKRNDKPAMVLYLQNGTYAY